MGIYTTILIEFLFISLSILLLFKLRTKLGLAPLYILLGSVQYLQANYSAIFNIKILEEFSIYPGSVILFSAVLFAVLLIYIKEGVSSARALILGIFISNFFLAVLFDIAYAQELILGKNLSMDLSAVPNSQINYRYFFVGTFTLLFDFFLLVIIYQFLMTKIKRLHFFLIIFISLSSVLIFDAFVFNLSLFYGTSHFNPSLKIHLIAKLFSATIFSILLYIYVQYIDKEKNKATFISSQKRGIFSILMYRKKYFDIKNEKIVIEKKLTSQLETTLNNISDGFMSLDANWCYTFVNKKAGEILGRTPSSLLGKHIWTEFPENVGLPFYNAFNKAIETQKTQYIQDYYKPFNKWFETKVYPSQSGITIYFTDVTELKKTELALKQSEIYVKTILDAEIECILQLSADGKLLYMNPAGLTMIEADNFESVKEQPIINLILPEYQPAFKKLITQIFKGESGYLEFKIKGLKGTEKWLETHAVPLKDNDGEIISFLSVTRDFTERKKAELNLIENEKKYRSLFEQASEGIIITDLQANILEVNNSFTNLFGYSAAEIIGMNINDIVAHKEIEKIPERIKQLNLGLNPVYERIIKRKDGTELIAEVNSNKTESGLLIGFIRDITDRKKAEEHIIKSEKYLENIINHIGDPVFVKDEQSKILLVNDAFCNFTNVSRLDLVSNTLAEDVTLEERKIFLRIDKQVLSTGVENINEEYITFRNKESRIISTKKTRFIDDSGKKFLIGTIRDVTKSKKAEIALKESEEKFSKIFQSSLMGFSIVNRDQIRVDVNDAMAKLVESTPEHLIGKTLEEAETEVLNERFFEQKNRLSEKMKRNGFLSNETVCRTLISGKELSTLVSVVPIEIAGVPHFISTSIDITDKKKAEIELEIHRNNLEELVELRTDELEKEKIKAQSADLMKSDFLATMSHELRTPMNSIIGFTSILLKEFAGPLNEEQAKQLGMVKNSGQHLLSLINDILDISKIEAGKLIISFSEFDYVNLLETTITFLRPQALKKGIHINLEISSLDIRLLSDKRRVEQILLNLISNAIKFSNKGTILIKVDVEGQNLITQIIDEGIGIEKLNLNKLFNPFVQLDGGLNRSHEGTGLGLSICKSLIEKLEGTIHVKSKLGIGSNFTFTLTLKEEE